MAYRDDLDALGRQRALDQQEAVLHAAFRKAQLFRAFRGFLWRLAAVTAVTFIVLGTARQALYASPSDSIEVAPAEKVDAAALRREAADAALRRRACVRRGLERQLVRAKRTIVSQNDWVPSANLDRDALKRLCAIEALYPPLD